MQNPNPNFSKISTAAFPSKETNPTVKSSKGSMEEDTLKIALEVLEELKASKNKIVRGDPKTMVANCSMEEVMGGVATNGQSIKKRKKSIEVKDINASKYPICPRCKGAFFTCNAEVEHLQKNPNYASSGTSNPFQSDLNKGADKVQPMEVEGSSNNAAAAPKPAECKGCGFDLNELPPPNEKGKKKRATKETVAKITLPSLVKYFEMPIQEASKNLNVGTTVLKRKCRELGLPRWPYRKIKSLDSLIHDLHQEEQEHKEMENKAEAMAVRRKQKMVEKEKQRIEKKPFAAIQGETKRLRQHVFKRRHKARVMEKQNSKVASK